MQNQPNSEQCSAGSELNKCFSEEFKGERIHQSSSPRSTKNLHINLDLKLSTKSRENESSSSGCGTATNQTTNTDKPSTSDFTDGSKTSIKRLDIAFENLSYTLKVGFIKKENKTILDSVNGSFKSGELTAIMGPSGAGKSTLLNILSGYTVFNISGAIKINGNPRELKNFISQSAYITQDTDLQPFLTVSEAMHFAANLKIGKHMTHAEKRERVKKILNAIGMYNTRHTRTGDLSGGQKKRLAIALELVNNPPVLILDEPTSGLDSSTTNQCISLLKKLALEGRTVICTIHQPSALVFGMFDHLYVLGEGQCIYSGAAKNVVPFLNELNLKCPESYNPADYLLEIATHDYGYQNDKLTAKIQNGANTNYRVYNQTTAQIDAMHKVEQMMEAGLITPVKAPAIGPPLDAVQMSTIDETSPLRETPSDSVASGKTPTTSSKEKNTKPKKPTLQIDPSMLCNRDIYASPFHLQLSTLLMRTFLILWRDRSLTAMRIAVHLVMALLVGVLYYGIGNDAANALNNFRYIFYTIMFIMYTAFSSILVHFPLEFPVVSREHFNRWYSLRAYYVALTLADLPIQVICTSVFILISYFMTHQPFEFSRIALFFVMVLMSALVGQSIGLTVGASLSVKNGAIFGPFFICPFLTFSGFFLQLKDSSELLHWLFHISFLKYSLEGSALAIFGYNRPKMECNEIYCHFTRPRSLLQEIGMEESKYEFALIALVVTFLLLRVLAFYIMSFRLRLFR